MNHRLRHELDAVSSRYRRAITLAGLVACWTALAAAGIAALLRQHGGNSTGVILLFALAVIILVAALPLLLAAYSKALDLQWLAHRIEKQFPDLDARLLAAVEVKGGSKAKSLGFLEQSVIDETVDHAGRKRWVEIVPAARLRTLAWANGLTFLVATAIAIALLLNGPSAKSIASKQPATLPSGYSIRVEPENTNLERGTGLIVLARFDGAPPAEVKLLVRNADGSTREQAMSRSLDDPVFAARVPAVEADVTYAVRHGNKQTQWYKAAVFDFPALKQADAKLKFPVYTGMPEKIIEDVRGVTAVEGTKATFSLRLNKPVAEAVLVPKTEANPATQPTEVPKALRLTPDAADPTLYTATLDMKQSAVYRLLLKDEADRGSKLPAELSIAVTANRPPDLKLDFPAKDVDVSPIEELTVRAKVWDDFGVKRVGVSYSIAGQPPKDVLIEENIPGKSRKELAHTVAMEKLAAQPDQLLSYYFWVEDNAADGVVRRTSSDMFFAEVRPFEEIFRQGEQPSEEEQRQQQQRQQQQGSPNGQEAEKLADLQKQIIAATWKVIRRETAATPTPPFVADVKLIGESQDEAHEKAEALAEKLTDEKSKAHVKNVLKFMESASAELTAAAEGPAIPRLSSALSLEQAAYQELLKLRAREHEVVRGQRQQQQQGQQSASSASSRRQRQLDQLKLSQEQNRYEQQRAAAAAAQQGETPQQRETRQVLSRLKELAQRQEDLNRQMKEIQSALTEAKEQAKKEELQRQLARLRDQQREMLRDTDELRDRTEQPENQERMADARQQLDQTRNDVRKASEALEQGKVAEAQAAGARASETLKNLREQVRKTAAGQFNDAVNELRQNARELDEKQQDLSERLAAADGKNPEQQSPRQARPPRDPQEGGDQARGNPRRNEDGAQQPNGDPAQGQNAEGARPEGSQQAGARQGQDGAQGQGTPPRPGAQTSRRPAPSLRPANGDNREKIAEDLKQQKENLEKLLEQMRQTIEGAEAAEPLLSKQLYDTVRNTRQQRTDEALDSTRQLVDRGFVDQARQVEAEAGKGIRQLRDGVEQAAKGVLGDETESLRRARAELDELARQLDREMARATGRTPATQPTGDDGRTARNGTRSPSTQPGGEGAIARAGRTPATQPGGNDPERIAAGNSGRRPGTTQPAGEQLADAGSRQRQPAGERNPQERQGQPGENPQRTPGQGQQAGQGEQPGQGQPRPGRGQQAGEGQPNEGQPGEGQPGQQGQQAGRGQRPGQGQGGNAGEQPGESATEPGENPGRQAGPRQPGGLRQRGNPTGGPNGGGNTGPATELEGPLTGQNFRQWSDRLRDVEEMVTDPKLRAEAARIRDRAKELRAEADRHSKQPNWDLVRETIGKPLAELRQAVSEELRRRESPDALAPIDRDPVPPEYAEQVRKYYERLGSGK